MPTTAPSADEMLALTARSSPDRMMHWLSRGKFQRPAHVRFMGDLLASVAQGGKRIILGVTVRHGKSWLGSWATPVWYLDCFPGHNVGLATYQANFAALWGRRVRNTIQTNQGRLNVRVADDSSAAHSWQTTAGGGMHTAGVGGEFTGRGFELMIIDDPIKNAEEANSEVYREKVWEWWQQTIYTRLEPNASVVVIMARWHEDDLAGRLLKEADDPEAGGGEPWEVIRLPAIAEPGDALGRSEGEALWPKRYSVDELGRIKRAVGGRAWSALYQQRPTEAGGGLFKRAWFKSWRDAGTHYELLTDGEVSRVLKGDCWRIATADTAQTDKTTSDYSVRQVWDVTPDGRMILVHQWRERCEAPAVESEMRRTLTSWAPTVLGIEEKQAGQATVQRLQAEGLPVLGLKANTDKVSRATSAAVFAENRRVFLPEDETAETLLDELTRFPLGKHDDQVDAFAHAANMVANRDQWRPVLPEFAGLAVLEELPTVDAPGDAQPPIWVYLRPGPVGSALLLSVDAEGRLLVVDERYTDQGEAGLAEAVRAMLGEHGKGEDVPMLGDPDADKAGRTNAITPLDQLRRLGFPVSSWPPADDSGWQARIDRAREALRAERLIVSDRCKRLGGEFRLWRHKTRPDGLKGFEGPDTGLRCLLAWVASDPVYEHGGFEVYDTADF